MNEILQWITSIGIIVVMVKYFYDEYKEKKQLKQRSKR